MAKKRLKKKQQQKRNVSLLRELGASKKEIKSNRNNDRYVNKVATKHKRNERAKERSRIIRSYGLKVKDYASLRYASETKWNDFIKTQEKKKKQQETKERRKKLNQSDNYLLMYWKDKTAEGFADNDTVQRVLNETRYMDNNALVQAINYILRTKEAATEIGTYSIEIVRGSEIKNNQNFMHYISSFSNSMSDVNNWITVYKGKAQQLRPLLRATYAMTKLMYDALERQTFVNSLIKTYLPAINIQMAKEMADLFQLRTLL